VHRDPGHASARGERARHGGDRRRPLHPGRHHDQQGGAGARGDGRDRARARVRDRGRAPQVSLGVRRRKRRSGARVPAGVRRPGHVRPRRDLRRPVDCCHICRSPCRDGDKALESAGMAVPPVPQSRTATAVRAARVPLLLDIVIGLLIAAALPLAVVAIPNTISLVATLLPPGISHIDMMRMHGLALPAMLLTVPLAMLAVRRFRAAPMAVAGLIVLALADVAGGYANSVATVGVLRALHGVGAGVLVTATLAAVYVRPRWRILLAIWGAALAASMVTAQALALWPLDGADSWRITLQPYPLLTGVALVL